MLREFLQRLDAFEDDPIAPVVGVIILGVVLYAILLIPMPSVVSQ